MSMSGDQNWGAAKRPAWHLAALIAGVVVVVVAIVVAVVLVMPRLAPTTSSDDANPPTQPEPGTPTPISGINPALVWSHALGRDRATNLEAVAVTADGGIVTVGYSSSVTGDFQTDGDQTALVVVFDGIGDIQWTRLMSDYPGSEFKSVAVGPDGFIYAVGYTAASSKSAFVVKLSPTGDIVWEHTHGGTGLDVFYDVKANDAGLVIAGYTDAKNGDMPATHGGCDALLVSMTFDGAVNWAKTFGGKADDMFYSVRFGLDGTIVVAGFTASHNGDFGDPRGDSNALVAGFTPDGALVWHKVFGGSGLDLFNAVSVTPDGSYFLAGGTYSTDGDLPPSNTGSIMGVYGTCTSDMADCQWHHGPDIDYYGAAVTPGGLAVAVGNTWNVGVLNFNDGTTRTGQAIPNSYPEGDYLAVAATADNQVVAVGIAEGNNSWDALVVAISFT